jgi:hypothetical protein
MSDHYQLFQKLSETEYSNEERETDKINNFIKKHGSERWEVHTSVLNTFPDRLISLQLS